LRLDLFLKASRLVLRRTVAQQLCDAGIVQINGVVAKSSRNVNVGDEITIKRRNRILAVRVLAIPTLKQPSRQQSSMLYEVLRDELIDDDPLAPE
jgi:ribosomal 50S subunit-recycling heat shock protein